MDKGEGMNIAVISLKDLIKYAICFIVILAIITTVIVSLKKEEFKEGSEETSTSFFEKIKNSSFLYCLKTEIPLIANSDEIYEKKIDNINILNTELALMYNLEESEIDDTPVPEAEENKETEEIQEEVKEEEQKTEESENLDTQVIAENNIKASYTDEKNTVRVNNQTGYDIKEILDNPNYEIKNKNKIIIYHTHTCESYTSSDAYKYEMTGTYRTTDLNYTVSRVGDELAKNLEAAGKTVVHDKTYHDYPAYNGSYGRSLKTMEKVLEQNKDAEITIDLHRDAIRK